MNRRGVAQDGRHDSRGQGGADDRDVVLGLGGDDLAGRPRAVGERDVDLGRVRDDVEAGQDVAGQADDDTAAEAVVLAARRCRRRLPVVSMSTSDGLTAWYTRSEKAGAGVTEASASAMVVCTSVLLSGGVPGDRTPYRRTARSISSAPVRTGSPCRSRAPNRP